MIRKSTWIVVVIFILLLSVLFLQQNETFGLTLQKSTATATIIPKLFAELTSSNLTQMDIQLAVGLTYALERNGAREWQIVQANQMPILADQGIVEQAVSSIASLTPISVLEAGYDLEKLALVNPIFVARLENTNGRQDTLKIGRQTPTLSGYYVQINDGIPVVVNSYAAEDLINLMAKNPLQDVPPPTTVQSRIFDTGFCRY